MKKQFSLTASNKTPERQVDSIKHEIKKYIVRERKKAIPEGSDFWDFDCKIGADEQTATPIETYQINKKIDSLFAENKETFYIEILAKPGHKPLKKA